MTLDIVRFLKDAFKKQTKISHFNYKIDIGKPKKLGSKWKNIITEQFGELFLNDANYVLITQVEGDIKRNKEKLADVASNIFLTEIKTSDIKALDNQNNDSDLNNELEDFEDENSLEVQSNKTILIMKITTK